MAQVVFDGQHVQFLYDDRGGDVLLITFNEMDSFADGTNYWGEAPARKLNLSAIGVMTKARNWYPEREMALALEQIRPLLNYKYIITYGFSQGAYGAIKYSRLLGATHALAFSPQWSIDPSEVAIFDKRFCMHFDEELNSSMAVTAGDLVDSTFIFADPYDKRDYLHATRIAQTSNTAAVIPCFNLGHGTVRAISSANALNDILRACQDNGLGPAGMLRAIRTHKKNSFAYYFALGQRAIKFRHLTLSNNLYAKACAINGSHPYLVEWRAKLDKLSDELKRLV